MAQVDRFPNLRIAHFLQINVFPKTSRSIFVRRKQSSASSGSHTTGSFSLKEVLRTIGTPVIVRKLEIKRWYLRFVKRDTVCRRPEPSTWQTAGISDLFSVRIWNTCIINGTASSSSNQSPTCSSRTEGAKGRNDSRRLIFSLSSAFISALRGSQ